MPQRGRIKIVPRIYKRLEEKDPFKATPQNGADLVALALIKAAVYGARTGEDHSVRAIEVLLERTDGKVREQLEIQMPERHVHVHGETVRRVGTGDATPELPEAGGNEDA